MARYSGDFTTGRYTRRNVDEFGMGYDSDYRGGSYGYGRSGGSDFRQPRERGWSERGRGMEDIDENWRSGGTGRGRWGYGDDQWGGYGGWRGGGYGGTGALRGRANQFGGRDQNEYDREMRGSWRSDYDEDVGDRMRRGWNRFRDEARGWMGRGYDRGW